MLSEDQIIVLENLKGFYEDDEDTLEEIMPDCGLGSKGNFERFKIQMARYFIRQASDFIQNIIDSFYAEGGTTVNDVEPPEEAITHDTMGAVVGNMDGGYG